MSNFIIARPTSYLKLTKMKFVKSKLGATALFTFTDTENPLKHTEVCMPKEDATPAIVESIFRNVNRKNPLALKHLDCIIPYVMRLDNAET